MFGLEIYILILLIISVLCVCVFEFINGFHDTANAVATVIYTNSLKPQPAVVLSGVLNFIGVFTGGIGVAIGIINLLPIEALLQDNIWLSVGMILSLLITAIIWNLATWYVGIPCSSSHTLIGSILGVGIAYTFMEGNQNIQLPWNKAMEVGLSLLLSPFIGLSLAALFLFGLRKLIKNDAIFQAPDGNTPPPMWIRVVLIATCSGVSFAHGSNDGQKGVGLMMLVLIAILPFSFAINKSEDSKNFIGNVQKINVQLAQINGDKLVAETQNKLIETQKKAKNLETLLASHTNKTEGKMAFALRKEILLLDKDVNTILKKNDASISKEQQTLLKSELKTLKKLTDYAPGWVFIVIAVSLGLGTMIGWKRIVVTIGEKIGKDHLTYAQGASAELIATSTIMFSSFVVSLPVSTTHILSSGVAGTMIASNGVKNLQKSTVRSIAIAWLLTLPVCIVLSGSLFWLVKLIV
jgi:low-affinity inorganic phosphate transporter